MSAYKTFKSKLRSFASASSSKLGNTAKTELTEVASKSDVMRALSAIDKHIKVEEYDSNYLYKISYNATLFDSFTSKMSVCQNEEILYDAVSLLKNLERGQDCRVYMMKHYDNVVAWCLCERLGDTLTIHYFCKCAPSTKQPLCVQPAIASLLLYHVVYTAYHENCARVELQPSSETNVNRLKTYYSRLGFVNDGDIMFIDLKNDELVFPLPGKKTSQQGGVVKETHSYNGRTYVVRSGPRGGKYILVKGTKIYVK